MILEADFDGTLVTYKEVETYWFIKHDWEIGFTRPLSGAPEVHYLGHYNKLTPEWQEFFYKLNNPIGFSEEFWKKQWAAYTADNAFITDYKGSLTHADYINRTNLDQPPMEIKCLVCGGNVLKGRVSGQYLYPEYINAFEKPPVGITYQSHPWLIHHATNIKYPYVNPFTSFGGRNTGIPVYYPLIANPLHEVRYPLAWLRKVEVIPNPYVPPMG
jgi:hypothetical protein